ncbi:Conserved_hypothetical protein [Hexamita inflata]|uniref:Uncharacterized protein n=1 Tax=Hexamita inflata TaxID=28002 RepID=A0AA86Q5F9_9EUKA|nr:Conserved hypothetical protein [Hexamita inflata]
MDQFDQYTEEQQAMLRGIATYVSQNHKSRTPIDVLLQDYTRLHNELNEVKINWHGIANQVGVDRNKLYHWYYDTHMRHQTGDKISKDEKNAMQHMIMISIPTREIEDPNFQKKMKAKIFGSRDVHRTEFSMTFNNLMRTKTVKAQLQQHKINLPTKRKNDVEFTGDYQSYSYANSYANSLLASGINSPHNEPVKYTGAEAFRHDQMDMFQQQVSQQLLRYQQQQINQQPVVHQSQNIYDYQNRAPTYPIAASAPIRSRAPSPPREEINLKIVTTQNDYGEQGNENFDDFAMFCPLFEQ